MKKTDKKLENALVKALTKACEIAQETQPGFLWLTHTVNYPRLAQSLTVICVFANKQQAEKANTAELEQMLKTQLQALGIDVTKAKHFLAIDSEENGADINNPQWLKRFTVH